LAVLLITYNLNEEGKSKKDYVGLYKIIKQFDWMQVSESSYAIHTSASPTQVYNRLRPNIDNNDHLVVIRLRAPWAGRHSKAVSDWLLKRIPN
jgi:hypothetical protein